MTHPVHPMGTASRTRRSALHFIGALTLALAAPAQAASGTPEPTPSPKLLRVAVIGGIRLCGVWDLLVPRIEQATGVKIDTVGSAPKTQIVPQFRSGEADLLLIHGGAETFGLQAEGIGGQQRVWAFNEHVIVGPSTDPAHIRDMSHAQEAFASMVRTQSPFVSFRDPGSHEIVQTIWKGMHLQASPDWVVLDETGSPQQILSFAAKKQAYVVVGGIPAAFEKLKGDGLSVLLKGDPAMRRAYVVMEPGPRHAASSESRDLARQVADYLTSAKGQADLIAADKEAKGPWLFPLTVPATDKPAAK